MPRLVYADWLDEHGDPKGELIRLLVEIREVREKHPHWPIFLDCLYHLLGLSKRNDIIDELIGRLEERQQRLFACECAESVLSIFEHDYPKNPWPRQAIDVAHQYANGFATSEKLEKACLKGNQWEAAARERWCCRGAIRLVGGGRQWPCPLGSRRFRLHLQREGIWRFGECHPRPSPPM